LLAKSSPEGKQTRRLGGGGRTARPISLNLRPNSTKDSIEKGRRAVHFQGLAAEGWTTNARQLPAPAPSNQFLSEVKGELLADG